MCCTICRENINDTDDIINCGFHEIHTLCAYAWFSNSSKQESTLMNKDNQKFCCPVCQREYQQCQAQIFASITEYLQPKFYQALCSGDLDSLVDLSQYRDLWTASRWEEVVVMMFKSQQYDFLGHFLDSMESEYWLFERRSLLRKLIKESPLNWTIWFNRDDLSLPSQDPNECVIIALMQHCLEMERRDRLLLLYVEFFNLFCYETQLKFGLVVLGLFMYPRCRDLGVLVPISQCLDFVHTNGYQNLGFNALPIVLLLDDPSRLTFVKHDLMIRWSIMHGDIFLLKRLSTGLGATNTEFSLTVLGLVREGKIELLEDVLSEPRRFPAKLPRRQTVALIRESPIRETLDHLLIDKHQLLNPTVYYILDRWMSISNK